MTQTAIPRTVMRGVASKALFNAERLPADVPTRDAVLLADSELKVRRSALLGTCRRLMRGEVYVPAALWTRP